MLKGENRCSTKMTKEGKTIGEEGIATEVLEALNDCGMKV